MMMLTMMMMMMMLTMSAGDDDVDDDYSGDAVLLVGIQERDILDPFSSTFIFLAFAFIKNFLSQKDTKLRKGLAFARHVSLYFNTWR